MSMRIKSLLQPVYKRSYGAPQSPFCYCNHHPFHVGFSIPSKPTTTTTTTPQDIDDQNQETLLDWAWSRVRRRIRPSFSISKITLKSSKGSKITLKSSKGHHSEILKYELDDEVEPIDLWEEEDDAEPEIGDGGDGGGVVLQNCPWGERALSIAHEILLQFGDDMKLYAFKTTPRGYIYVRLDKLSNDHPEASQLQYYFSFGFRFILFEAPPSFIRYGCPSVEEIESYSHQYIKRLDEVGALGEIPGDLALEVSSPSAERLLKVPDDMNRFKDMPMRVSYVEDLESKCPEKNGVFYLDSIKTESGSCVWRLAGVKENGDPSAKGRPLSCKQKDWRLELPYAMFKKLQYYFSFGFRFILFEAPPSFIRYGCPSVEEIESYSHQYKKRLDEVGALGEIPDDLALEVKLILSAERLLKVPDDMNRFKDMPMRVSYVEDLESKCPEKNGVFYLDSIKTESGSCVWRLAGVKENRDPSAKGRPLSRKQKDWRLELPYAMLKKVTLFLDY
ncbi:hypothetical protein TEA_019157 [Camellia sinensis var. sinensis]|uniref:DUF7912 domain-containing protein n=1 Tax=Camellia sinensis var. sinensis TaxID=542762 RepID=A0A4S4EJL6_CAMSN|nr:hypothetical protein TEA_019157 [Camellia sinensis var. sinensis]